MKFAIVLFIARGDFHGLLSLGAMHKKLMKEILNDIDNCTVEPDVDDGAPRGAGNWYLGHCVQKQGVLYPRWGTQVKPIYGLLLDIYGVMYDEEGPIPGSIDAVRR